MLSNCKNLTCQSKLGRFQSVTAVRVASCGAWIIQVFKSGKNSGVHYINRHAGRVEIFYLLLLSKSIVIHILNVSSVQSCLRLVLEKDFVENEIDSSSGEHDFCHFDFEKDTQRKKKCLYLHRQVLDLQETQCCINMKIKGLH